MVSHQGTTKDDVPYEFTDRRVTYDIAAWNIQRISQCKIELCFEQNYDLMALTELGDRPHDAWEFGLKYPGRIMCSDPSLPTDPAAGAAILLSARVAKLVITWEAQGTRIVWVRLRGADYNTIFVSVYVPHK